MPSQRSIEEGTVVDASCAIGGGHARERADNRERGARTGMVAWVATGILLAVVFASPANAATTFVQGARESTSRASLNVAYPAKVGAGDLLVGQFRVSGAVSVSDSVNGAWTQAAATTQGGVTHAIWYRQAAVPGATTVTVSGGSGGPTRAVVAEYSGVATSGAFLSSSCNQGTTSSVTTAATGPVPAGDLLFAGFGVYTNPITATSGSSDGVAATLRTQFTGPSGTSADEDVTSTAAGGQDASFTLSSRSAGSWAACAAAFQTLQETQRSLMAVTCPTSTACTAVGTQTNGNGTQVTLAERWNGATWTIQSTPNPTGTAPQLNSASCTSSTTCTAVGSYTNTAGTQVTLAERWNGATWTIQSTPNTAGDSLNRLNGLSCTSSTTCNAVGDHAYFVVQPLAERWNGASWATQNITSSDDWNHLASVSCTTTSACIAVGIGSNPGNQDALAERWNGTSWTMQTTVNPAGTAPELNGVSCASSTACTAVGSDQNTMATLAERWNGSNWQLQSTP